MKFPHAYKGVLKLFVAEIISIAAAVVGLVTAILANIPNLNIAAPAALGTVSIVALIVAFVLQLIGLIQASRDEYNFRAALFVVIVAIVLSIVNSVLTALPDQNTALTLVEAFLEAFSKVASIIVIVLVLGGIANLAEKLHNSEMAEKGHTLVFWVVLLFAISVLFGLFPNFFVFNPVGDGWSIFFTIITILAAVIELVVYINVLVYLYKATKMLKK